MSGPAPARSAGFAPTDTASIRQSAQTAVAIPTNSAIILIFLIIFSEISAADTSTNIPARRSAAPDSH